jgi:hypothetical protein
VLLRRGGIGLDVSFLYWLGVVATAALLVVRALARRPGDLRRLDAAFFTMNGVISVVFFAFVASTSSSRDPRRGIEKRYGRKRVLTGVDVAVPVGGFALVTGPNGSGKTTLLRMLAGSPPATRATSSSARSLARRLPRARAARLPRAHALENLDLFGRLYRVPSGASASGCCSSASALGRAERARFGVLARDDPAARALPSAAARAGAARARRALLGTRRGRSGPLDRELGGLAGAHTLVVATHDPERLAELATQRLALA